MKKAKDTIFVPDPHAHHLAYLSAFGEEGDVERFLAAEQAELDAAWAEPEPSDGRCWSDEDEEEAIRMDRFWGGGD